MNEILQKLKLPTPTVKNKGAWFILTGLILGVILGTAYSVWINPVVLNNAHPASLIASDKDIYRITVAQVYAATGNFDRAYRRLELLNDVDPFFTLGAQAQRALHANPPNLSPLRRFKIYPLKHCLFQHKHPKIQLSIQSNAKR